MGSDVNVRALALDDLDELDQLIYDERAALNRDSAGAIELAYRITNETNKVFVAMDGERMAGFAALTAGDRESDVHIAQLRIHLRPEYRANGLGSELLQAALAWADDKTGIRRVVATPYMQGDWNRKVRFFEQHGFRFEAAMRHGARLLDGSLVWVIQMSRTT